MKRGVILVHRWTGVLMCVLLAAWFASGVVMLFVGYPKLTPWERLAPLPALPAGCCIAPEVALERIRALESERAPESGRAPESVRELTLTSIAGRPHYVLTQESGSVRAVDAVTGAAVHHVDAALAVAGARALFPGAVARYAGTVDEDRWTHSRALNRHRPLHVVEVEDAAATRLYVSSATGQVVLDAARAERGWNYVGAWLHWLYMLRNQPTDPVWSWTVIALSGIGVLTSVTGLVNGIVRWRFARRYKSGSRSPFRAGAMRWHHIVGLLFGAVLCTWIFSGLMSMNPVGVFDPGGPKPDAVAYEGKRPGEARVSPAVPDMLAALSGAGFRAVELEWRVLAGKPYVLARDRANATRLVFDGAGSPVVAGRFRPGELAVAARRLMAAPIVSLTELKSYDAYYFRRRDASMYGGQERRLPVLRVTYGDPGGTWAYLDPATGKVEQSLDRSQRAGRWLFNLLHSWDIQPLLRAGWMRDALLIVLSAGGLALSAIGIAIGTVRVRAWLRQRRNRAHDPANFGSMSRRVN